MSFVLGCVSIGIGIALLDWLVDAYVLPMIYQPRLLPVRVRTAEEQRQYDECNRTMRPGQVRYTFRVKPFRH